MLFHCLAIVKTGVKAWNSSHSLIERGPTLNAMLGIACLFQYIQEQMKRNRRCNVTANSNISNFTFGINASVPGNSRTLTCWGHKMFMGFCIWMLPILQLCFRTPLCHGRCIDLDTRKCSVGCEVWTSGLPERCKQQSARSEQAILKRLCTSKSWKSWFKPH